MTDGKKATPQFGLRQQGHTKTILDMLVKSGDWQAIGEAIGWDPAAAQRWFEVDVMHADDEITRLTAVFRAELDKVRGQLQKQTATILLVLHRHSTVGRCISCGKGPGESIAQDGQCRSCSWVDEHGFQRLWRDNPDDRNKT